MYLDTDFYRSYVNMAINFEAFVTTWMKDDSVNELRMCVKDTDKDS